jgi:hypothetical protein
LKHKNVKTKIATGLSSLFYLDLVRLHLLRRMLEQLGVTFGEALPRAKSRKQKQPESLPGKSSKRSFLLSLRDKANPGLDLVQSFALAQGLPLEGVLQALREVARVIGLEHQEGDFGVNYMLAAGI